MVYKKKYCDRNVVQQKKNDDDDDGPKVNINNDDAHTHVCALQDFFNE